MRKEVESSTELVDRRKLSGSGGTATMLQDGGEIRQRVVCCCARVVFLIRKESMMLFE